jgi:hypothetical protein
LWTFASNTIFLHSTLFLATVCLFYYSHNLYPFQPCPSLFYMVLLFSFFLSLYLLQFVLVFFGLAFFQHDNTIFVRGILYILNHLFPVMSPLSPCFYLFFSVLLILGSPYIFLPTCRSESVGFFRGFIRLLTRKSI